MKKFHPQTSVIQIPGVTHGLIEYTVEILNQTGDMAYFGNATKIMSTLYGLNHRPKSAWLKGKLLPKSESSRIFIDNIYFP